MEDGTNGIRVKERDRVIVSGGERACNGHGKEGMSEMFLAISQVFPVRERPCPTPCQLIYGLRATCKRETGEEVSVLHPYFQIIPNLSAPFQFQFHFSLFHAR